MQCGKEMCQLNVPTVTPHQSTQRISAIETASINIRGVPKAAISPRSNTRIIA
jgi:hypothetical protein